MPHPGRPILISDDDATLRDLARGVLVDEGYAALAALTDRRFSPILTAAAAG